MIQTKICTKCGEEKEASSEFFHKDKNRIDGYFSYCKKCVKNIQFENKLSISETAKKYRRKSKSKAKKYNKMYQKANKEDLKIKRDTSEKKKLLKDYQLQNRERFRLVRRGYRLKSGRVSLKELSDSYCVTRIKQQNPNLTTKEIRANPKLIELKRLSIKYYREHLKEKKNE